MIVSQITLVFATTTFLLFVALVFLSYRHRAERRFFYGGLFFLCSTVVIFSQYMLEMSSTGRDTIFWSKFLYFGGFAYMCTFPLFLFSLASLELKSDRKAYLFIITAAFSALVLFTNLIVSDKVVFYSGLHRAGPGPLYVYAVIFCLLLVAHHFVNFIVRANRMLVQYHYYPLIGGLGFVIFTGLLFFLSTLTKRPVITGLRDPLSFGVFVASLTFYWTFISQYSLNYKALSMSETKIGQLVDRSSKSLVEFVEVIAKTLDAKDQYNAGHSTRVMRYAVKIAEVIRLDPSEIEILRKACLLHDIGKIGIPDGILNKKSPLTERDWQHIYKHPTLGKEILSTVSDFQEILDVIYSHHERVDGTGYPKGLKQQEIPLLARIIAVADAFDAMLSERPYRKAKTKEEALQELVKAKGVQLDETIVDRFIEIFAA